MSWYKTVTLRCDLCGADGDSSESTVEDARKSEGFVVRTGQDVCPECQGKGEASLTEFFGG